MNSDLLIYFFATILIISVIGVFGFNSLNEINSSLKELSADSSYLFYKINVEDNVTKDNILYEKQEGESIQGLHRANTFIYLNIRNRSNYDVCKTFMHELGHKVCYPDLSESCADDFREKNLFRCEGLE